MGTSNDQSVSHRIGSVNYNIAHFRDGNGRDVRGQTSARAEGRAPQPASRSNPVTLVTPTIRCRDAKLAYDQQRAIGSD